MRGILAGVAGALAMALAGAAQAATVSVVSGPVSLNKGGGFKSIRGSAPAKAGDTVMAGAGGQATITYDDGCKETVNAGETASVAEVSPCKLGAFPGGDMVLGVVGVAAVVGGVVAISNSGDNGASSP